MYRTLFYAGLILAVVFLIAAVVLFFVLKIPKALGVVTGRTERRAIEEIRAGGIEARSKREARRESEKRIHVREVEMETGSLGRTSGSPGRNAARNAVNDAARDAARDAAKAASAQAAAAQASTTQVTVSVGSGSTTVGRTKKDRSKANEQTEVLGFTGSLDEPDMAAEPQGDETEILGGGGYNPADDEATDVLSSDSGRQTVGGATQRTADYSPELEEETDVLSSGPRPSTENDMETDVLFSGTGVPEDEKIVGRYSAEETAVLRSIHTESEAESDKKEIRIIYSETIVHTDESL